MQKTVLSTEEKKQRKSEYARKAYLAAKLGIPLEKRVVFTKDERVLRARQAGRDFYQRNKEKIQEYRAEYLSANKVAIKIRRLELAAKNKEVEIERSRLYRLANKDRINAYRRENAEAIKAQRRAHYLRNKEEIIEKVKIWAAANKDKVSAAHRAWGDANREQVRLISSSKRARKKGATGKLTNGIAAKLMLLQKGQCACCRASLKKTGHHLDHINPLALGGAHDDSNVQLLCPPCNMSKHAKNPVDFMQSRGFLI